MLSRKNLAAVAASAVIATGVVATPAFAAEPVDPDYSVATVDQDNPKADSEATTQEGAETEKAEGSAASTLLSELSSSSEGKSEAGKSEGSSASDALGLVGTLVKLIMGILG
ncbi:hypothetical protein H7347_04190 [Corynebacterium sp. zg-331]|uniref:hypothetical protein n=1 Tax=unclassified Corynebacterium TaxID=2624378 RepID=UPI00128B228D|nr:MULTISPECIES: hypothetical protein [unclassified Corynebacterium]MBC3185779.1 hypothetical protein [Corynebacterium sp. zg-331]MPV52272.1 hypothetical protein [Corynebacterium sp. zg331]